MSKAFIEKVLKRYAKNNTFKVKKIDFVKYKNTRALNREIIDNTKEKKHFEWLFYIEKTDNVVFQSPLNYIGEENMSETDNGLETTGNDEDNGV